jgi:integrase
MPLSLVKRPNGYFYLRGTHHGVSIRQSAGTRERSAAEAVKEALEREIFERVVLGKQPDRSFAEAAEGYMRSGGEREFMAPILRAIGEMPLKAITQDVIDKTAEKLFPTQKPSTRLRKVYTPISAVMSWAADAWGTERRRIRRPSEGPGRVDWRTPDEIEALLAICPDPLRGLITFYVGTGCRASEALGLDWKDVSLKGHRATFWETKGGYSRHVDLQPRVRDALPARTTGPVWLNSRGEAWHAYDAINLRLRAITKSAGLPPIHCHVLRHTWATWAYACTRDLTFLMGQGGWKSSELAMRYIHAGTDDLAEAVKARGWFAKPREQGENRLGQN